MTLILIFDALSEGKISLEDEVVVSEYAASMGGSQVYLEAGEIQTAETLIKCISVASANDACVAMAEYICGTEDAFVSRMNERASALGMTDTTFVNCCGLDTDGHMTCAYDIALMSRELTVKYPQIFDYCNIWTENITHTTSRGTSEFGLTNTNKLIRQYQYATGLKTGSTDLAKYCLSATATRDDVDLIAVVMAAPDAKARFNDAAALLNYGFAVTSIYTDNAPPELPQISVKGGVSEYAGISYSEPFTYLVTDGSGIGNITSKLTLPEYADSPIAEGDTAGELIYYKDGTKIGSIPIVYDETVEAARYGDYIIKALHEYLI
jgi:D-alanyl-D-alanine carboxypeptidase (penicillin-binding protein 5/6)